MKAMADQELPKWTVTYNSRPGSRWQGTAFEFFDTEADAQTRYDELSANKQYPTKRPYYHVYDRTFLRNLVDPVDDL